MAAPARNVGALVLLVMRPDAGSAPVDPVIATRLAYFHQNRALAAVEPPRRFASDFYLCAVSDRVDGCGNWTLN